jgi:hypothetical protein
MKNNITKINFVALVLSISGLICILVLKGLTDSTYSLISNIIYDHNNYYYSIGKILYFSTGLSSLLYFIISLFYFIPIILKEKVYNKMIITHSIGGFIGIVTVFPYSLITIKILNNPFSNNSLISLDYILNFKEIFHYGFSILIILELITFLINKFYKPKHNKKEQEIILNS